MKLVKFLSMFIPVSGWRKCFRRHFTFNKDAYIYENLLNKDNAYLLRPQKDKRKYPSYSIGITTYDKRFETYFKPLIKQIRESFSGPVIVCINGTYKETLDEDYRKQILSFLSQYSHVYPVMMTEFRSLAKLWNTCLINAPSNNILLLNDDVSITSRFFVELENAINQNRGRSFKINSSWSHVFLNRNEISDLGWFDERLLSIGWEDNDFEARWFNYYNYSFPNICGFNEIHNLSDKQDVLKNQKIDNGKYSRFNKKFFYKKYKISKKSKHYQQCLKDREQYPYEKFYWENKNEI